MGKKKWTKFIAGLSSLFCLGGSSSKKADAYSLMQICQAAKGVNDLVNAVGTVVGITSYIAMSQRNAKVGMKNLVGGPVCQFRSDLSPELFQSIGKENSFFEIIASRVLESKKQTSTLGALASAFIVKKGRSDINNHGILMAGPSGCGKSMLARIFTNSFVSDGFNDDGTINQNCKSVFKLSSASIDTSSKESVWKQLLADKSSADSRATVATNPFRAYIEKNPNGGIIIFDEFEKVYNSSLAEGFRNILDNGEIQIEGIKYPMRNYIFIFTSNASPASINPKCDSVPELSTEEKELGYTRCNFDRSFLNRLTVIPFEPLKVESLGTIFYELIERWNYENINSGINLRIDIGDKGNNKEKSTISKIASYLYSTKKGGREAEKLFDQLLMPLYFITKKAEMARQDNRYRIPEQVNVSVKFDEETSKCYIDNVDFDEFLLENINKKDLFKSLVSDETLDD